MSKFQTAIYSVVVVVWVENLVALIVWNELYIFRNFSSTQNKNSETNLMITVYALQIKNYSIAPLGLTLYCKCLLAVFLNVFNLSSSLSRCEYKTGKLPEDQTPKHLESNLMQRRGPHWQKICYTWDP